MPCAGLNRSLGLRSCGRVCGLLLSKLPDTVRVDFRETLSKNPRFIEKSYTKLYFLFEGYKAAEFKVNPPSKYRQQRFSTGGVAFTF